MPACFMSLLLTALKHRHGQPIVLEPVDSSPYRMAGEPTEVRSIDVAEPIKTALAQSGKHADGVSMF